MDAGQFGYLTKCLPVLQVHNSSLLYCVYGFGPRSRFSELSVGTRFDQMNKATQCAIWRRAHLTGTDDSSIMKPMWHVSE